MPQLERSLNIWKYIYSYVQDIESSVPSTFLRYLRLPKALQVTLFWKKMILYEIFQVGACPNLKDSSLYDRFSIHMYKAWCVRFLWLFCAICDSFMPCTVHLFGKRWFFSWHISSWCMPPLERFLSIWTVFYLYVQDIEFGTFNFFSLSATP